VTDQDKAESQPPSLDGVAPAVADAPEGEVTLGEKAGAFGPWRAHQVIDAIAQNIAEHAAERLRASGEPAPRVLVVDDRRLLPGEWTARYASSVLLEVRNRLDGTASQLHEQQWRLDNAITRLEDETRSSDQPQGDIAGRRRGIATGDLGAPRPVPDEPAGGVAAAVNLLSLLRTDYTVTAAAVSATPSELSTLTAAHLIRQPATADVTVTAEVDAFSTAGSSPILNLFDEVLRLRGATARDLADLQGKLAPVQAKLTAISAEASAVVAAAQQVVTDADAAVAALVHASGTGDAPLVTAVRYERLGQAVQGRKITHVLYVSLDAIAADVVTRRSILGTSGRVRFLSSGNASWLLLATADDAITGGGQESLADVMTLSLDTGQAHFDTPLGLSSSAAGTDPLDGLEKWAKGFIAVLALVLFALGVLSVIAIVRVALGS
jgi:hypothetical protein